MKSWNLITPDNEKLVWYETQKDILLHRFPKVDDNGFVWLEGYPYVVDDAVCVREYYHDRKLAGIALIGGLFLAIILSFFTGLSGGITGFLIGAIGAFLVGAPRKEDRHYYWRVNEPAPIIFNEKMTPGSIGIPGKTIATYAKSEHLKRLVAPEMNWMLIIVICVLVGIMAGAIGYSVGINQGVHP